MQQVVVQEPTYNPVAGPDRSGAPAALIAVVAVLIPVLLAFALSTTNEMRVTGAVMGITALVLVLARPFLGLILFVALLYVRPEELFPALQGMRSVLIVSLTSLVGCSLQLMLSRERLVRTPLGAMMIGFALAAIASAIPLGTAGDAAQEVGKLVALVILILNLVRTPERYRAFVTSILIFTAYLACYSAYLYFTGQALKVHDIQRSQTSGIFGDPNDLAATIASGLALALSRVAVTRGWSRSFHVTLAGIYIFAILLTNSRGGMLSLLIVAGGFFWVYVKRKSLALLLAAIAMSLAFVAAPSRMKSFDNHEESANTRFWFWHNGIEQFKQTPVLGSGFGTFPSINGGMTAHNSFVLCFTELGLVGYFFWMGCIYYCFRPSPLPPEEDGPPGTLKQDLLGAKLALAAFLTAGFFLSRTYVPILYVFLSLPMAAQVASSVDLHPFKDTVARRARDYAWIFSICILSIAFTKFLVDRLR